MTQRRRCGIISIPHRGRRSRPMRRRMDRECRAGLTQSPSCGIIPVPSVRGPPATRRSRGRLCGGGFCVPAGLRRRGGQAGAGQGAKHVDKLARDEARGQPRALRRAEDGAGAVATRCRNHTFSKFEQRSNHNVVPRFRAGTRLGGEFDPGSGSTLAACLMHASRAGSASADSRGGRVRSAWATCPGAGGSRRKRRVIPRTLGPLWGDRGKAAFGRSPREGPAAD